MVDLKPITIGHIICDKAMSVMFPENGKLVRISNKPIIYQRM